MFCMQCGSEMPDGVAFCTSCGAKMTTFAPEEETAQPDGTIQQPQPGVENMPEATHASPGASMPGSSDFVIRPLDFGQLFDVSIKLYFKYFKYIAGAVAVVMIPFYFFFLFFQLSIGYTPSTLGPAVALYFIPLSFLMMFAFALQQGAVIRIISDIYLGKEPSIADSYRAAFRRFVSLILGGLLYFIIIAFTSLLLLIPGIYFSIALFFMPYIIMIENKGATDSLNRSLGLVSGSWWKLFLVLLLAGILTMIAGSIVSIPMTVIPFMTSDPQTMMKIMPFTQFVQGIVQLLVYPFTFVIAILFYYDLRVRKEGFDIEMMANEILG